MQSVNSTVSSIFEYVKDSANPFIRLVTAATEDDSMPSVTFFQMDEIREATFQSDYACEMIFKGLLNRLDTRSLCVRSKVLRILQHLVLEGAAGINMRMGQLSGRLIQISSELSGAKNTLEDSVRRLAMALQQAITGDSSSLIEIAAHSQPGRTANSREGSDGAQRHSYKSEFQSQQEREQRLYRKRLEEEKKCPTVVVRDRQLESFDSSLTPERLVEAAMTSSKKKFVREELDSFVGAALQSASPEKVCALLEAQLTDKRQTLQNRFKVLLLVEALLSSSNGTVHAYFSANQEGLRRHCVVQSKDNALKAEAAKETAQNALKLLQQPPTLVTAPPPTHVAPPAPEAPRAEPLFSAAPSQSQTAWQWNGPNVAPTAPTTSSIDDLFADMTVKAQAPPRVAPAASAATGNSWWSPSTAPVPVWGSAGVQVANPQPHHAGIIALSPAPPPPPPAEPTRCAAPGDLLSQAEELQRNMQAMYAAMFSQSASAPPQAAPPAAQQQEVTRPTQSSPPPQTFQDPMAPPEASPQPMAWLNSNAAAPLQIERSQGNDSSDAAKLAMLQQLQQQMEATQKMLAQQQAAFLALQSQISGPR